MSVITSEINKFTSIASKWWDLSGPFKMLHEITPLRLEYILKRIRQHYGFAINKDISNLKILDVGCGGGLVSMPLARIGAEVVGIDAGRENIQEAENKAKSEELNIKFFDITVEEYSKKRKNLMW